MQHCEMESWQFSCLMKSITGCGWAVCHRIQSWNECDLTRKGLTELVNSSWILNNSKLGSQHGRKASRGFEPRSLDSESRVLTVTPRGHTLKGHFSPWIAIGINVCLIEDTAVFACGNYTAANFVFSWSNAQTALADLCFNGILKQEHTSHNMHQELYRNGHTGDWTQGLPHAERVWYHYTMCPMQECISFNPVCKQMSLEF